MNSRRVISPQWVVFFGVITCIILLPLRMPAVSTTVLFDGSIPLNNLNETGYNDTAYGQRIAEDFSFTSPVIVSQISFLGGYYPTRTPLTDAFKLTIYNNDASRNLPNPSSIVVQINLGDFGRTDTGVDSEGIDVYSYRTSFSGVTFAANTFYWLTIVNDTSNDFNDGWVWAGNRDVGVFGRSYDGGLSWYDKPSGSYSFVLEGVIVPEPTTAAMLMFAGAYLAKTRLRR